MLSSSTSTCSSASRLSSEESLKSAPSSSSSYFCVLERFSLSFRPSLAPPFRPRFRCSGSYEDEEPPSESSPPPSSSSSSSAASSAACTSKTSVQRNHASVISCSLKMRPRWLSEPAVLRNLSKTFSALLAS